MIVKIEICRLKRAFIVTIMVNIVLFAFAFASLSMAANPSLTDTKTQLQALDKHISSLKKTLITAHDQHHMHNDALAKNEIQIGTSYQKLQQMKQVMLLKEQEVQHIQHTIQNLNKKLVVEQKLLNEHLRIRYQMGLHPPFSWMQSPKTLDTVDHLIIFHHYLLIRQKQILESIRLTKTQVDKNKTHLAVELTHQKTIEKELRQNQEQLEQSTQHHRAILASLNNEIQSKEQRLLDFERNKKNLSHLIERISNQNNTSTYLKHPFKTMRHQLPHPIREANMRIEKSGSGVTFFSREGSLVYAVYPGKVVFSDWLNGYGLLLIIDHGNGFMTLYAHNQSLIKHKGESVTEKDSIATSGFTGGLKPQGLYFEVRQGGKAVFPLEWLTKSGI